MNESDFTLTGSERVKIPPHCANCPIARLALQQLERYYEELNSAIDASMDPEIIKGIQEGVTGLALEYGHSNEEAAAISAEATEQVREHVSDRACHLDRHVAGLTAITRDCPGVKTMRAKVGDGMIQATLCMNPELVESGGESIQPVSVTRRSL